MAFEAELSHLFSALAALLGALLIQIGTNLSNDYFDFVKGADTEERLGPARATQAGWIRPEIILRSSLLVFAAAVIIGIFLVLRGGWPIVLIGIASVICGILYTGGPYPLAYLGLGEIFVVIFFGPVATLGTYYVQALEFSKEVFIAGLAPGLLSTALIAVNNLRDIPTDIKARKKNSGSSLRVPLCTNRIHSLHPWRTLHSPVSGFNAEESLVFPNRFLCSDSGFFPNKRCHFRDFR